jgi:hypothetical protein
VIESLSSMHKALGLTSNTMAKKHKNIINQDNKLFK